MSMALPLDAVAAPETAPAGNTYRDALAAAMRSAMADHDHTLILGQGVTDHKGIFGTTTGLLDAFGPERMIETPLAEDAVTGICIGAALNGLYPINTHIRADFGLLAVNQLVNLAAKYRYMFGGLYEVPMLVRMVVGRSWGQGAQHSQSPQSLFAHNPGLTVIMPSSPRAILTDYAHAIAHHRGPVVAIEHRLMYDLAFEDEDGDEAFPPMATRLVRRGRDVTIAATSIMVLEAKRAARHLASHGIDCEIIDLNAVSHIDRELVLASLAKTGRLLVADTSWQAFGVAAELSRIVAETDPRLLLAPVRSLGMQPCPCPTAKALEDLFYPSLDRFVDCAATLVRGEGHGIPLPGETSMADVYKHFKGPF
ncbi:MAG: transketolase C-terminal domain-containing protein [Alphaproteobacteria bacterium]